MYTYVFMHAYIHMHKYYNFTLFKYMKIPHSYCTVPFCNASTELTYICTFYIIAFAVKLLGSNKWTYICMCIHIYIYIYTYTM